MVISQIKRRHQEKNNIIDDLSEILKKEEVKMSENELDTNKLAALKEKFNKIQQSSKEEEFTQVKDEELLKEKIMTRPVDKKCSIKFGFVGSGQGGDRLAETAFQLGYKAVACNTATQDLDGIKIPEENKLLLQYGIGGAAKTLSIGHEAAELHREELYKLIEDKLGDCQAFVFAFSLGGGSGAGSSDVLIDILSLFNKPIIIITVLPMTHEDALTKQNSLETLSKVAKYVQEKKVHNVIVVDNARIETIYKDVSQLDFYPASNMAIMEILDAYNTYSMKSSVIKALDSMEFAKILTDGEGLSLYGCLNVENYEEDTAIAEAIVENMSSNLLASGFDLKQAKYIGVMMIANEKVWACIPSSSIDYAMSLINDHAESPLGVYKGIYVSNDIKENVVKVYSFFSGLALPVNRIDELKKDVELQKKLIKNKETSRNLNLNIDTGETEATSLAQKVKDKIKAKKSAFATFTQNMPVIDRRNKQ